MFNTSCKLANNNTEIMNSISENNNVDFLTSIDMLSDNTPVDMEIETDIRPVNEIHVNEIWKKSNFSTNQIHQRTNLSLTLDNAKMSWSCQNKPIEVPSPEVVVKEEKPDIEEVKFPITPEVEVAPPHHARRPMNAFLIFCKKHRPIVRKKYPNLENRGVTRILGEWWALLDAVDKDAYTHLAKEYKDAFFSANPNFKWYKLPAPPLRQLPGRPTNIKQESSPPPSPIGLVSPTAEFTPGKLADESQLGMLSSLLNLNQNYCKVSESVSKPIKEENNCNNNNQIENNNQEDYEMLLQTPVNNNDQNSLPPKPIKKRYSETSIDNKNISRNLFESDYVLEQDMTSNNFNMTNQHIVDSIIDSQFDDEFKDTRKSGRKGKGNRYAEFMVNGKLIKNKRDKRDITTADAPKLDLNNTIKRLEERIQPKHTDQLTERTRTISEVSDTDDFSKTMPSFNLDQRIADLPNLSYDTYLLRKKESKKRKFIRTKPEHRPKTDVIQKFNNNLTGSKKRKNKNNITHLEKNSCNTNNFDNDLSGLATLAEIAAITEKIINT